MGIPTKLILYNVQDGGMKVLKSISPGTIYMDIYKTNDYSHIILEEYDAHQIRTSIISKNQDKPLHVYEGSKKNVFKLNKAFGMFYALIKENSYNIRIVSFDVDAIHDKSKWKDVVTCEEEVDILRFDVFEVGENKFFPKGSFY